MGKECISGNAKKYNLTGEYNLSLNKKSYKISIEKNLVNYFKLTIALKRFSDK